jgi:uncharacterized membrane protein
MDIQTIKGDNMEVILGFFSSIILIMFIVMCINVGIIRKNIQSIYSIMIKEKK